MSSDRASPVDGQDERARPHSHRGRRIARRPAHAVAAIFASKPWRYCGKLGQSTEQPKSTPHHAVAAVVGAGTGVACASGRGVSLSRRGWSSSTRSEAHAGQRCAGPQPRRSTRICVTSNATASPATARRAGPIRRMRTKRTAARDNQGKVGLPTLDGSITRNAAR